jgi:hypothetical protein
MLPTDDKARKALPLFTYITEYFPDSLIEECRVAVIGNDQHNPGEPLHWAREKSTDQLNTAFRHMLDHKSGVVRDKDGAYHLAKAIWRLKAELQLQIERDRAAAALSSVADDYPLAAIPADGAPASEFG